jgi:hypothetical protein
MNWLEMIGYVASGLTFMTFYMKAMLPLRYIALCSNIAFITYGYFSPSIPGSFASSHSVPPELRSHIGTVEAH